MKPYSFFGKSTLIGLSCVSAVAFTSCQKEIPPVFKNINWESGQPVVLVAGWESNGVTSIAKYWINNQEVILSDGTNDAKANSIFSKGNNVYIAGNDAGAVYWKNNAETKLPAISTNSSANSIYISGNNAYIAGSDNGCAVYWKNGAEVILNNNKDSASEATSVFISGNDIYVAGFLGINAVYWKNGVIVYLTNNSLPGSTAIAYSINISGGDVHVVGSYRSLSIGQFYPILIYWKNGVEIPLSPNNSVTGGPGNAIFASGNNVYIAGVVNTDLTITPYHAAYWKNGTETILPSSAFNSFANSIYVSGNDVYVAGTLFFSPIYAVYWKNGEEVKLTDGTMPAAAVSIFVK
ncbi:MAG: hypothetical protein Q8941_24465 [Bacteroidota bacterium]|nr:hypothetical protein [Bacteroidota bacterium]